jgi:hypothetical protein
MPVPKFNIHWTPALTLRLLTLKAAAHSVDSITQILQDETAAQQLRERQWQGYCADADAGEDFGSAQEGSGVVRSWITLPVVLRKMQELYFLEKLGVWWDD